MTPARPTLAWRHAVAAAVPRRALASAVCAVYPRVEPELAALGSYMPRGGTAVDIGAWFGPWSRRMRRYADQVVAIEAHPELAALLTRSTTGIRVVAAAASDESGQIDLVVPPEGARVGVSSVEHGEGVRLTVARLAIDDLELTDVRFMKLDVEGHELAALRGAASTIRRDRPLLLLELEERMQPVAAAIDFLAGWGYRGWVRPQRAWQPLSGFDLVGHQEHAIARVSQSFLRRLVWARPRYVNMVLFTPDRPTS
jgi:FkbM family methyltransferase